MITQRVKVQIGVTSTILFDLGGIFHSLKLNSLVANPAWITETLLGGYIVSIDVTPTSVGTSYIYYTLGGSPSLEDALLIIDCVGTLTEDLHTCVNERSFIIDTVTNYGGYAQVNLLYDFDTQPKVNDYILILSSNYTGYWRVKNVFGTNAVVLDKPYIGAISLSGNLIVTFERDNSKCLVWINREGGRSCYTFDQRKNYDGIIGKDVSFDNGTTVKYVNRGKNFDYITVYKTGISDTEVDLIESLRYSIQAWEYDLRTNTSKPIIIDSGNYAKYNTKVNFNDITLKYKVANYKQIQTQ